MSRKQLKESIKGVLGIPKCLKPFHVAKWLEDNNKPPLTTSMDGRCIDLWRQAYEIICVSDTG